MAEDRVPLDPSVWGGSCSTALALAGCESAADTDPRFLKKAFVLLRMLESGPSVGLLPPLPPLFELRTDSTVDVLPNASPPAAPCLFLLLTLPALARPLLSTSTSIGAPLTMMDPGSGSTILESWYPEMEAYWTSVRQSPRLSSTLPSTFAASCCSTMPAETSATESPKMSASNSADKRNNITAIRSQNLGYYTSKSVGQSY